MISDAVILAAGLGTRLSTVTRLTPKPLALVNGKPIIDYVIEWLSRGGIDRFHVNLHYLGYQIQAHLQQRDNGDLFKFYHESTQLLGTGGGIVPMLSNLKSPFIVINADSIILEPLLSILDAFKAQKHKTPFLLVDSNPNSPGFGRMKMRDGEIHQILDAHDGPKDLLIPVAFCGFSILSHDLWRGNDKPNQIPQMLVKDVFIPWLMSGNPMYGYNTTHIRFDVGTPDRLEQAENYLEYIDHT